MGINFNAPLAGFQSWGGKAAENCSEFTFLSSSTVNFCNQLGYFTRALQLSSKHCGSEAELWKLKIFAGGQKIDSNKCNCISKPEMKIVHTVPTQKAMESSTKRVHAIELKARASRDLCTEAFWFIFLFCSNFASRSLAKAFSRDCLLFSVSNLFSSISAFLRLPTDLSLNGQLMIHVIFSSSTAEASSEINFY